MSGNSKMRRALKKGEAMQDSAADPTSAESSGAADAAPPAESLTLGSRMLENVLSVLSPSAAQPPSNAQAQASGGDERGISPSAAGIAAQSAPLSPEAHTRAPPKKWDKLRASTLQIPASINDSQRSNDPHEDM